MQYSNTFVRTYSPILVLNAGSSSLKYRLFKEDNDGSLLSQCHGKFEFKASNKSQQTKYQYTHYETNQAEPVKMDEYDGLIKDRLDYVTSIDILFNSLLQKYLVSSSAASLVIGHRIVHGGDTYSHPQLIDDHVLNVIDKYSEIAPLHNPYQLQCIKAVNNQFDNLNNLSINAQFAVFDTAFHSKMPEHAYKYAINKEIASQYESNHNIQVRRYGFHGISYQYVIDRVSKYFNKAMDELNLIIVHLGSGCSICCIKNGVSIDTSMGFTPNEGIIMATRCGDIDIGLVFALQKENENIENVLNKSSGLKGICGTNDMREILYSNDNENENEYEVALNMFAYRIKKYIGAYYALLNGNINGLIFTGGIGENIPYKLLYKIVGDLDNLRFNLNTDCLNDANDKDIKVWNNQSIEGSVPILSVMTDEELSMAQQIQNQMLLLESDKMV